MVLKMLYQLRLMCGILGFACIVMALWITTFAFVDVQSPEFHNFISIHDKKSDFQKSTIPRELLKKTLGLHDDASPARIKIFNKRPVEEPSKVHSTSTQAAPSANHIAGDSIADEENPLAPYWNGSLSTLIEMVNLMNLGDPSYFEFSKSINTSDAVITWTHNRLVFRCDMRAMRASGRLDPNATIIAANKTPPLYHTVEMPVDIDVASWILAVGSLFADAKTTGALPVFTKEYGITKLFENITMKQTDMPTFAQNKGEVIQIVAKDTPEIKLRQGTHKWHVDDNTRWAIKTLFTFKQDIYNHSLAAIVDGLSNMTKRDPEPIAWALPSLIGVHINFGNFSLSDERLLLRAMLHYQRLHAPLMFWIFSNNMTYCKELFTEPNVVFVENVSQELRIALTSLMDFIILTEGIEGWLGAYLSEAVEVLYIDSNFSGDSANGYYYLPEWTRFR